MSFWANQQRQLFYCMTEESRVSNFPDKYASLNTIISLGGNTPEASRINEKSKRQIEVWLQEEARLLVDKQERHRQKQQKLKAMEEQYERERREKQKQIDKKIAASETNKHRNIEVIQKKLNLVSNRHKSVLSKIQNDNLHSIQKQIDERKVYETNQVRTTSRLSHKSNHSSLSKNTFLKKDKILDMDGSIDKKIFEINLRLEKANSLNRQKQAKLVNRIHLHNTSQIQTAQQRAVSQLQNQINQFSYKIATKIQSADLNKEKVDSSIEKKQEEKERIYSQKLRKYQDNIKHLQSSQLSKYEELNKKFQKNAESKVWRDERGEVYHRKFLANLSSIEHQKAQRADQIIQKHQEISMKNKIYKQRKDTLFKAIKCETNL